MILPIILRTGKKPVVFSRWTGMGDILCTIPAARELMKRHPQATFIYNCHPDFGPVPRLGNVADVVTSLASIGQVGHWYAFLLGGFYHFAHGDDTPGKVARETMIVEFCRQFDLPVTDAHPQLTISAEVQTRANKILLEKRLDAALLIVIHPGPSWMVKEWPRELWARWISDVKAAGYTNIAQLGVGRYMNFGQVAVDTLPGAISLVDSLSIEECLAVIARAKLFVGIDSGLLHLAACAQTPCIGLWGSTSPQFFYPENLRKNFVISRVECQGCYHRLPRLHWVTGCPYEIKCMKTLAVKEVLDKSLSMLA